DDRSPSRGSLRSDGAGGLLQRPYRLGERHQHGRPASRRDRRSMSGDVRPRGWWLAAAFGEAAPCAIPASAQDATEKSRAENVVQLPYWPGYWVAENQAGTTISGMSRPSERSAESSESSNSLAIWANNAPWNDEGRRRI